MVPKITSPGSPVWCPSEPLFFSCAKELKAKMNHFRSEGKKRLADLTMNARTKGPAMSGKCQF